jgi:hypothetical protein
LLQFTCGLDAEFTELPQHSCDRCDAFGLLVLNAINACHVQQRAGSFQSKEVDHAVPWFVDCHCRGWGTWAQKDFNICLPERTGNGTVSKVDARGSYSAIYVFHGALDFSVRYRLTSWQTAFNVAVSEGFWYRARKVGPVRNYDVEARVANADGDGFNIALIGTTDNSWKHCYDDYFDLACSIVAGCPS